jgi:hypothetical protein
MFPQVVNYEQQEDKNCMSTAVSHVPSLLNAITKAINLVGNLEVGNSRKILEDRMQNI